MKTVHIIFTILILFTAIISYLLAYRHSKQIASKQSTSDLNELIASNSELSAYLDKMNIEMDSTLNELNTLKKKHRLLALENNQIKQKNTELLVKVMAKQEYFDEQITLLFDEQISLLQENKVVLKKEFENLANDILEKKVEAPLMLNS